jgi:cyanophycin synthetase
MPVRVTGQALAHDRSVDRSAYYEQEWRRAASALSWSVEPLGRGFLRLTTRDRSVLVRGAVVGVDDVATYLLAGDKVVSGCLLAAAGLPVPSRETLDVASQKLRQRLLREGSAWVLKPAADTGGGQGATVGPTGRSVVLRALAEAAGYGREVICEQRVTGRVVRVLVFDGEVLDGVERAPATVTGDGRSTVRELVAGENRRRAELRDRSTGFVPTGADFLAALRRSGLRSSDRPAAGEKVGVSGKSNTGSEQQSDRVHLPAAAKELARRAAAAVGVRLAGVDLILGEDDAVLAVLEVNTTPGLHWHELVSGSPLRVFTMLLRRIESTRPLRS